MSRQSPETDYMTLTS